MKTYPKALHLTVLATLVILIGVLAESLLGYLIGNDRGPSLPPAAITTPVCPEPGDRPAEPLTATEPLPFDCGIGEASGEHNQP